jgi:hypothetical protein
MHIVRSCTGVLRRALSQYFSISCTVLFVGVACLGLIHHELWRDELQSWGITATSPSLSEMLARVRYEGHPALWYVLLYALNRVSSNPTAMQALHLAIATSAVYIFCRFAPFTRLEKMSVVLGYYMVYEYAVISRNYALGVLGLFLFAALKPRLPVGSLWLALLLTVAINSNAYAAIIAFMLTVMEVWLVFRSSAKVDWLRLSLFIVIVGAGTVVALGEALPLPDSSPRVLYSHTVVDRDNVGGTLMKVWQAYVPIPRRGIDFWNTNIFDKGGISVGSLSPFSIQVMLSLGLIILSLWLLGRRPRFLLLYSFGTMALLSFMHVKMYHGLRHSGHLFILLIVCIWLLKQQDEEQRVVKAVGASRPAWNSARSIALTALLVAQPLAAGRALEREIRFAFSSSSAVASYITSHGLLDTVMVGTKHYIASSVALSLNHPIYYAESDRIGTFVVWKAGRRRLAPAQIIEKVEALSRAERRNVLLISSYEFGDSGPLKRLVSFTDNVISDERYILYLHCYPSACLR